MRWSIIFFSFALAIGGLFRFYHLNWDEGFYFHPDERNIAMAVQRIQFFTKLNPEFFAYGSFPIYLNRAFGELLWAITKDTSWVSDWGYITLIGRFMSATASTVTILLVYLTAQSVFSIPIAIIATWFVAFTPFLIQQAHFGVTESIITFFAILLTYLSLKLLQNPTKKQAVIVGVVLGLAIGTKISSLSFTLIPVGAILLSKGTKRPRVMTLIILIAVLVFILVSPYTFLSWQKFRESMNYEGGIVVGKNIVVYVYQFLGTTPYLYQGKQLLFTQGPILAILSIIGSIYTIVIALAKRNKKMLFLFLWPFVYFVVVGSWYAKFLRYMMPIYPFLAVSGAFFLWDMSRRISQKWFQTILVGMFCVAPFLGSYAFMHIYISEQTRITASQWIYQHVPDHSVILTEHWDDGLPINLPNPQYTRSRYTMDTLEIYQPDNEQKLRVVDRKSVV